MKSSNQFKSATGNNGAFSEDNDIMFSEARSEETEPSGHAQPLSALVLTPSGFRPMGDIRVGDEVLTPDGSATQVINVFPQGKRPLFRIRLDDGSQTRATADHLWTVREEGEEEWKTVSTALLIEGMRAGRRFELPGAGTTKGVTVARNP
jgi:hypothetical protein